MRNLGLHFQTFPPNENFYTNKFKKIENVQMPKNYII